MERKETDDKRCIEMLNILATDGTVLQGRVSAEAIHQSSLSLGQYLHNSLKRIL
jgi:hypothetical protein